MRGWVTACSECVNTCRLFLWELSRGTEPRATVLEFSPRTERVTSIQLSAILPPSLLSVTNTLSEQTPTVSTVQGLGLGKRDLNPQGSFYLCLNLWRVSSWFSDMSTSGSQWTSISNKGYEVSNRYYCWVSSRGLRKANGTGCIALVTVMLHAEPALIFMTMK